MAPAREIAIADILFKMGRKGENAVRASLLASVQEIPAKVKIVRFTSIAQMTRRLW